MLRGGRVLRRCRDALRYTIAGPGFSF